MLPPRVVWAAGVALVAGGIAVLLLAGWPGGLMIAAGVAALWRAEMGRQDARTAEIRAWLDDPRGGPDDTADEDKGRRAKGRHRERG